MILHTPQITIKENHTIVWSKIELAKKRTDFPSYLWFRLSTSHKQYLSLQSDAFLASALLAAMNLGETLEVCGPVSPRMAYHLEEYQFILSQNFPKDLRPVEIIYQRLENPAVQPRGVGVTFSGGVDSLYTLWNHLPQNQPIPSHRITHALFIHGFDIFNKDIPVYDKFLTKYKMALREIDIELCYIETNLVSAIIPRQNFAFFYSSVLAGCAHLLAGLFRLFYIPSSWSYFQWGNPYSFPLTDRLLSSDTLGIIHHGATCRRVDKVKAIVDWKFAQLNLRVCPNTAFQDPSSEWSNCSRCEKCLRTMIPIYALGRMAQFETFSKPLRSNRSCLWWARKYSPYPGFTGEIIPFVQKYKGEMVPWLRVAALFGMMRYQLLKLVPRVVKRWLQRFGYFIDPFTKQDTYENIEVVKFLESIQ